MIKRLCENTRINFIHLEAFKGTFADVRKEAIDIANHEECDVIFIFQDKIHYVSLKEIYAAAEEIGHEEEGDE